jgi:hypothetical protein
MTWVYSQARGRQRKLVELETGAYLGIELDRNGGFSIYSYHGEERKLQLAHYTEEMEARDVLDTMAIKIGSMNLQYNDLPHTSLENVKPPHG